MGVGAEVSWLARLHTDPVHPQGRAPHSASWAREGRRIPSRAPGTAGRQVADGEAWSLLAARPNCSGRPKCELIAGPARASGPHTPGWGSFTVTQRSLLGFSYFSAAAFLGGGRPCLDPHLLPPSPGPHNSQSLEAPFSPLRGPLGSPVRPGRFLSTGVQSSCSQRRATDARGEDGPSGTNRPSNLTTSRQSSTLRLSVCPSSVPAHPLCLPSHQPLTTLGSAPEVPTPAPDFQSPLV